MLWGLRNMMNWIEKNKRFTIGFLATITTMLSLFIYQKTAIYFNKSSIEKFVETQEMNDTFMHLVIVDMLFKFMVGLSAIYSLLFILKIVFSLLYKKFRVKNELEELK